MTLPQSLALVAVTILGFFAVGVLAIGLTDGWRAWRRIAATRKDWQ
jgi:hypothetical protein